MLHRNTSLSDQVLRRLFLTLLLLSPVAVVAQTVVAQTSAPATAAISYPSKTIRFIVPYPPGGPLDQIARMLAEKVRDPLGQAVVVENRAGAGGNIGADLVAKAAPDGHTIVMGAVATHAINPALFAKMPYDANKDFAPITRVAVVPNVLVFSPATAQRLNIKSTADLVSYAKANPGRLNFGSGGNGSAGHLAGELLKSLAKISMVHIAYNGAAPAQVGLIGGQTDFMFDNLASATPQIKAGKLSAFAVTTPQRTSFFPELPTISQAGISSLSEFDISTWFGVFAPANTPVSIVQRLNSEFAKALALPDTKERMARLGAEPAAQTPDEFARFVRAEQKKYSEVVKISGAKID